MSNTSYSPSDIVKQMHEVLHLDSSLREVSNQFDITTDSTWNDYTKSLLPMPLICMVIGLLAVIIFQLSSCCYCCCKKKPLSPEYRDPNAPNIPFRNCWIAFAVFFVVVIVYDQSIIFGNEYLSNGVSTVNDGLDYLETTFTSLDDYGDDLNSYGDRLLADFTASYNNGAGCPNSAGFISYMDDYFSYIEEYQSYVHDVPGQCQDAQDAVHTYAVDYKTKTVWVFYAMFIVCILIYLFGMLCKNKPTVFVGFCAADIVMFLTFIICGVTMILLVLVADFCMEPSDNVNMIAPDSIRNVTAYYTECVGQNPMQPSLTQAEQLVVGGKIAVQDALDGNCPNDPYLQDAMVTFDAIQAVFVQIEGLIACPPNQRELLSVLNDGMCGDTFKGLWVIWLAMFVCAGGLFAATVAAACAYPHFPSRDDLVQETHAAPLRPAGSAPSEDEVYAQASPSPHHPPQSNYYQGSPVAHVVGSSRHGHSEK